jgi:uncharacterized protein
MIELSRLPAEGLRTEGRATLLPLERGEALRDAEWSLRVLPSNSDFYLEVLGKAVWEGNCSRCLEPFELALRLESRFLGSKDPDLVVRGSHTLGSQDLDVVFFPEPFLDEDALVREQFQLQIPMHAVCKETCQGLCPQCGKNWNKGPCTCRPESQKAPSALAKALSGLKLNLEP